mgnify:CR=1 FL=1
MFEEVILEASLIKKSQAWDRYAKFGASRTVLTVTVLQNLQFLVIFQMRNLEQIDKQNWYTETDMAYFVSALHWLTESSSEENYSK